MLARIPELAASTGSACHSGDHALSPVLQAMGVSREVGAGAIRFSLGRESTLQQIEVVVDRLLDLAEDGAAGKGENC
jgi:cysteine desulfurase